MNKIKIFQSEINDGVAEQVAAQASVAYCSPATVHEGTVSAFMERTSNEEVLSKVLAENKDQKDLHYIESVLVSTGWNKNDDVFNLKQHGTHARRPRISNSILCTMRMTSSDTLPAVMS